MHSTFFFPSPLCAVPSFTGKTRSSFTHIDDNDASSESSSVPYPWWQCLLSVMLMFVMALYLILKSLRRNSPTKLYGPKLPHFIYSPLEPADLYCFIFTIFLTVSVFFTWIKIISYKFEDKDNRDKMNSNNAIIQ